NASVRRSNNGSVALGPSSRSAAADLGAGGERLRRDASNVGRSNGLVPSLSTLRTMPSVDQIRFASSFPHSPLLFLLNVFPSPPTPLLLYGLLSSKVSCFLPLFLSSPCLFASLPFPCVSRSPPTGLRLVAVPTLIGTVGSGGGGDDDEEGGGVAGASVAGAPPLHPFLRRVSSPPGRPPQREQHVLPRLRRFRLLLLLLLPLRPPFRPPRHPGQPHYPVLLSFLFLFLVFRPSPFNCRKIRRSSYHDVVRVAEIQKVLEISGVQTYVINSARVLFLNERPQPRGTGRGGASASAAAAGPPSSSSPHTCEICARSLLDPFRFCSLGCKLAGIKRNGDATFVLHPGDEDASGGGESSSTAAVEESKSGRRGRLGGGSREGVGHDARAPARPPPLPNSRRRKGIPHRAPFAS
ncbi:hypothetical protein BHM03_00054530, partial [Ensete ventricosum]